jgi:hypothetical protein
MRDKIRNILREETHPNAEKYINYCVQDYMNGAEVLPPRELLAVIRDRIIVEMTKLLDNEKKFC